MTDTSWYEEMASAMKERDRALTGLARWQQSLREAEDRIEELKRMSTGNRYAERITDAAGNVRNGDGTILEAGPELQARIDASHQ